MTSRGLRRLGLAVGLAAYGLWIAWQLGVALRTNGRLLYTIDDAYIHMAMARNLAEHATYGVSPSIFSSASSSPLWTLIMGAIFAVSPRALWEWVPFGLGLACTIGSFLLVAAAFTREVSATSRWQAALAVPLFALLPIAMGLPTLVFHGMEHSLHMLATLAFVALLGAELSERQQARWLVALAFAIPLIRFESLAPVFAAAAVLWFQRRRGLAGALVVASLAGIATQGIWSLAHGESFLPNSVLVKLWIHTAGSAAALAGHGVVESAAAAPPGVLARVAKLVPSLVARWGPNLGYDLSLLASFVAAIALGAYRLGRGTLGRRDVAVLVVALATYLAQTAMTESGPNFARYSSYLTGLGLLTAGWLGGRELFQAAPPTPYGVALRAAAVAGFALVSSNLLVRESTVGRETYSVSGGAEIARFLAEHTSAPLAVEELGAIAWWRSGVLIDIFGLANHDVAQRLLQGRYDAAALDEICRREKVELAVVSDLTLPREPARGLGSRPAAWRRVGCFLREGADVRQARCVYAVDPAAWQPAYDALAAFALRPGTGVHVFLAGDPTLAPLD